MDGETPELFITLTFEVKIIRVISNVLVPSDLTITASIERTDESSDSDVELMLTKWRYWFDHVVAKSVVFDTNNDEALAMMLDDNGIKRVGNMWMLCPEDPSDEVIGALFQAKMNALGMGKVVCAAIDIKSDNLHGLSFTLAGDHVSYLPATTEAWLGGPSQFAKPWWSRNDASSFDVLLSEGQDTSTPPPWAYSLDHLLDRSRAAQAKVSVSPRASFTPTVIDGGKPDDDE